MCESQKRKATEGKSTLDGKIHDNNDGEEESGVLQLEREVSVGDLIWVKFHRNSWWPALVVDENGVSASCKPGNRSEGEVLVRLYGSYEYQYADLMKYYSEFKKVLGQNNGNLYEIFDKALEQDCSRIKSIKPKGQGSKSTANKGADASKGKKKLNQNRVDESNPDATARKNRALKSDIQKKPKRKRPSTDEQAKNKANEQERVQKKQRKSNQTVEKTKPNTKTAKEAIKQSSVPNKMPKSSNSEGRKRSKTSKQSEEQKKGKPKSEERNKGKSSSPSSSSTNSRTPKQDKKTNSQSSERTAPGKSPKSSARRVRVMQGLGLTAPPGSPFQKN